MEVWIVDRSGRLEYQDGVICSGVVVRLKGRGPARKALVKHDGAAPFESRRTWLPLSRLHKSPQQQYEAEMGRVAAKGMRL